MFGILSWCCTFPRQHIVYFGMKDGEWPFMGMGISSSDHYCYW